MSPLREVRPVATEGDLDHARRCRMRNPMAMPSVIPSSGAAPSARANVGSSASSRGRAARTHLREVRDVVVTARKTHHGRRCRSRPSEHRRRASRTAPARRCCSRTRALGSGDPGHGSLRQQGRRARCSTSLSTRSGMATSSTCLGTLVAGRIVVASRRLGQTEASGIRDAVPRWGWSRCGAGGVGWTGHEDHPGRGRPRLLRGPHPRRPSRGRRRARRRGPRRDRPCPRASSRRSPRPRPRRTASAPGSARSPPGTSRPRCAPSCSARSSARTRPAPGPRSSARWCAR